MTPESRPLVGYYCMLNLTKALLTCVDPPLTAGRMQHGLSDGFTTKKRYWFNQEAAKIQSKGLFRDLAEKTGMGYCYAAGQELKISKLTAYLPEIVDLHRDSVGVWPKLLPLESMHVWSGRSRVWLRAEIDRGVLTRYGLTATSLLRKARAFGGSFRVVQSGTPTVSFETEYECAYVRHMSQCLNDLQTVLQSALIAINRGTAGPRYLLTLSERKQLLSQEAVTFCVMLHLSNMVRYRPDQVAKLADSKWFLLFSSWVPRALENYFLMTSSRILKEEVWIT
jgi:hypothetical protein